MLFFGLLLAFQALSAQVKVQANLDNYSLAPDQPVKGTLSITHTQKETIDPNSFTIEGKPLQTHFVQDTQISDGSDLLVTFYSFMLPGQAKGLHILPPISVKVGGKVYQSLATTYDVSGNAAPAAAVPYFSQTAPGSGAPANPTSTNSKGTQGNAPAFKLEGSFIATPPIYPGQKITMFYRYYFNTNIELTEENLPLLEAPGFRKIGSRDIKDSEQGDYSVREVSQEVVATKPGKFDFPGAVVEGYLYRTDEYGVKQYQKPKLHVETLPVSITINPFPDKERPASFNGAVGAFSGFKASLNSPSSIAIGDKITLGVDLTGTEGLEAAPLPDLCCQPGFSGVFQTSDLPPTEKVEGNTKHFEVELRPLTDAIKAIPVIEFSYFDPKTQNYNKLHSEQIALEVHADQGMAPAPKQPFKSAQETPEDWQNQPPPPPVEDHAWVDETANESSDWSNAWWIFLLIPLALLLLLFQRKKKEQIAKAPPIIKPVDSRELFEKALKTDPKSADFQKLLTRSFLMRLVEKGGLPTTEVEVQKMPTQGKAGQVRAFLLELEEKRYSGQENTLDKAFQTRAKELFDSL